MPCYNYPSYRIEISTFIRIVLVKYLSESLALNALLHRLIPQRLAQIVEESEQVKEPD